MNNEYLESIKQVGIFAIGTLCIGTSLIITKNANCLWGYVPIVWLLSDMNNNNMKPKNP